MCAAGDKQVAKVLGQAAGERIDFDSGRARVQHCWIDFELVILLGDAGGDV